MAARALTCRHEHVFSARDAPDLALHDAQYDRIALVILEVDRGQRRADTLQPRAGIVVARSIPRVQRLTAAEQFSRKTIGQKTRAPAVRAVLQQHCIADFLARSKPRRVVWPGRIVVRCLPQPYTL